MITLTNICQSITKNYVLTLHALQPEWTDDIYIPGDNLVPGGDNSSHGFIEVSSFPFVLVANVDDSGDYNRKLLQSMLSVQTSANELFAASGMPGDVRCA